MTKRKNLIIIVAALILAVGIGTGFYASDKGLSDVSLVSTGEAAGGKVTYPVGTAPDRYIYLPGTEELGKDEIRLIALGTGMPAARRSQAATC
ncbi:MAG: hypothetical protein N2F24_10035, partial [Deltaproteobacteria bacterium]